MKSKELKVKVIFWEDIYRRVNISLNLCGLIYHIYIDVEEDFKLKDTDIYFAITSILYFEIDKEEEFITEDNFKPYNILNEEEFYGKYFNNNDFSTKLKHITIN